MIHLIILAQWGSQRFAYHLASKDKGKIKEKKAELLGKVLPKELTLCNCHIIMDPNPDFASIRDKDPYFNKVILYPSLDEFLSSFRDKMNE